MFIPPLWSSFVNYVNSDYAPVRATIVQSPQIDTQMFLQDNGVMVEAWAPFAEGRNSIFQTEVLLSIAARHNRSVAQVILRWLVQRGIIALAKSTRKERMIENISVFDFELGAERRGGDCYFRHENQ